MARKKTAVTLRDDVPRSPDARAGDDDDEGPARAEDTGTTFPPAVARALFAAEAVSGEMPRVDDGREGLRSRREMPSVVAAPIFPVADDSASRAPEFPPAQMVTTPTQAQLIQARDRRIEILEQQLATALQFLQMSHPSTIVTPPVVPRTDVPAVVPVDGLPPPGSLPHDASSALPGSPSEPRATERSLQDEVEGQLSEARHGDSCPIFDRTLQIFAGVEIEGLVLDERRAFRENLRHAACKNACDGRDVLKFTTSDAVRLGLFLEAVVRLINMWEVQPGDWTRVLLYHVDNDVLRSLRQVSSRPRTFGAVVRYLWTTYPVSGAVKSMRIVEFRSVVQGNRPVRGFYEDLLKFYTDASGDFPEAEVTRQFVNNLRDDIRGEVQREYDRDVSAARLLPLYQLALGTELRATQTASRDPPPKKSFGGSWYGKPKEHSAAAAVFQSHKGTGGGGPPGTSKVGCYNCGSNKHFLRECVANCGNCKQAGHTVRLCLKPCPTCGGPKHAHRYCNKGRLEGPISKPDAGTDSDHDKARRTIAVIANIILPVQLQDSGAVVPRPHRVLLTRMAFKGHSEPLVVGLDTMAAINVIPKSIARDLNILASKQPSQLQLHGVGKSNSEGVVQADLSIYEGAPWESTSFEVLQTELPPPVQVLLSLVWLEQHHADMSLRPDQPTVSLVPSGTTSEA